MFKLMHMASVCLLHINKAFHSQMMVIVIPYIVHK